MNKISEEDYKKKLENIVKEFIDDYMKVRNPGNISIKIFKAYYKVEVSSSYFWTHSSFEVDNIKVSELKYKIDKLMEEYRINYVVVSIVKEKMDTFIQTWIVKRLH